jgi:three-Cys-motif partner protein
MVECWGGHWTAKKLAIFESYLTSYLRALKNQSFQKIYVDAFAGKGFRVIKEEPNLFCDGTTTRSLSGSPLLALERSALADRPFDSFVFIELSQRKAQGLEELKDRFPAFSDRIHIKKGDANSVITELCSSTDWTRNRALLFLDPFGMQVKWNTLRCVAETRGIDVWLLFPLGVAVTRLMPKTGGVVRKKDEQRLNDFFGTDEWQRTFYNIKETRSVFDETEYVKIRTAGFTEIAEFTAKRLAELFKTEVIRPFPLYNTKSNPLYLLYFVCANPKGASLANRIADQILHAHAFKQT